MQPTPTSPPLSLVGRSEARRDLFFFSARTSTITIADPRKPRALGRSKNPNYLPPTSTSAQTIIISLKVTHTQEQHKVTNTHTRERQIDDSSVSGSQHQHSRGTHALLCSHHPPTRTAGRPHDTEERSRRVVGGIATAGRPARITSGAYASQPSPSPLHPPPAPAAQQPRLASATTGKSHRTAGPRLQSRDPQL